MRRLDFIIGGGQRCGSTTIATMLARHADVCLCQPLRPEPKFFLHDKHEAPALAARIDQSLAHAAADVTAVGEKSTSYLEVAEAAENIFRWQPQARLIFILRHPLERAISNYRFSRAHGLETLDFDTAIRTEPQRLANTSFPHLSAHPFAYLRRGHYAEMLGPFCERFERQQLLLLLHDDLRDDPAAVRDDLARFLHLRADGWSSGDIRMNAHEPDGMSISSATAEFVVNQFTDANRELEAILGRDLSAWGRVPPLSCIEDGRATPAR